MSEAKPQDGSTVKGYRTLTAGDIERMNRLKGVVIPPKNQCMNK